MYSEETRIYFALLAGVAVLLLLLAFYIVTIIRYQKRKSEYDQSRMEQQFSLVEQEKERIAYDLHDDLGGLLSAIKLRLQTVVVGDQTMQTALDFAEEQIDVVMAKLRVIAHNMMPSILKRKGLNAALEELIEQMLVPAGITVDFSGTGINADTLVSVHLFRISQEIFNNILKHSGATAVEVVLLQAKDEIILQIRDNGKGFTKGAVYRKKGGGAGLKNIIARAEIIRAKVYLRAEPGEGVDYQIVI